MRWFAYINKRIPGGVQTDRENFEVPNTTKSDGRYATMEAAKKFKVDQDDILALPCCKDLCKEDSHTPACEKRWQERTDPVITKTLV